MRKILLIGSKGMAGHVLYHYFKNNPEFEVVDIARNSDFFTPSYIFDVTDLDKLQSTIAAEMPHVVVNCIGILNKDAENNPDKAILLNSYLPHFLAKLGRQIGFKFIHISTDCVFNGKKGQYTETDIKDGIGFYAQSKALGEVSYGNNLTLRTSIIGPELKKNGIGLLHWFLSQTGEIKGYTQAFWTGVTTLELAKAVNSAIDQDLTGLHHLVNSDSISKFALVNIFASAFSREKELNIIPYDEYKIDKSLVRTDLTFNYNVPSYQDMVKEMRNWMLENKFLYKDLYTV